jgi:hypothetical protein
MGFAAKAFIASASKDNVNFLYSDIFRREIQAHVLDYVQRRCLEREISPVYLWAANAPLL